MIKNQIYALSVGLKNIEDTFQDCEFKIKRANDGGAVVVRRNYHEKN